MCLYPARPSACCSAPASPQSIGPLSCIILVRRAGLGLYGFRSHFALQGSQLAIVWPVTSTHLLCFNFPSLNAGCVYSQCHNLHSPVNTWGAKLLVCAYQGPRLAGRGVSSELLLLSEGCTVLVPGWGPGERGAAFLPLFIGKTVSRNQFCGGFDQINQCS